MNFGDTGSPNNASLAEIQSIIVLFIFDTLEKVDPFRKYIQTHRKERHHKSLQKITEEKPTTNNFWRRCNYIQQKDENAK